MEFFFFLFCTILKYKKKYNKFFLKNSDKLLIIYKLKSKIQNNKYILRTYE